MSTGAATVSEKLTRYKELKYEVPKDTLVWQLTGKGLDNFRLDEIPLQSFGPRDIRFRSDTNGICFSDVKIVNAGLDHPRLQGRDIPQGKVVPGHEVSLTVMEVGDEVKDRFSPGERYIVQADMLKYGAAVGYDIWGGMMQYGVFDERVQEYLIKVERDIGYSQASLVEPWACVEASYQRADLHKSDRVVWVVGGGGPMGQMHLLRTLNLKRLGRLAGLEAVVVTDVSDERLAAMQQRFRGLAEDVGVRLVGLDPRVEGFEATLRELAPEGIDYIIACAQIPEVVNDTRRLLKRYGVLNLFAGIKRGAGDLNLGDIHYDQHTVTGNTGSRIDDMEDVLRQTERAELDTNASAGAVVGMRACAEGVRAVAEGKITNKVILYPQLPDLPLTRIKDIAKLVDLSPEVQREVRAGVWSQRSEEEMLAALLEI